MRKRKEPMNPGNKNIINELIKYNLESHHNFYICICYVYLDSILI
ncbi:hypothetical protein [Peptostreptococcus canis]|nr:hypothetical protein [Peptostreptococcus canis]MBP1997666.1 hypothetical protein [Peptostreptococcus canis]